MSSVIVSFLATVILPAIENKIALMEETEHSSITNFKIGAQQTEKIQTRLILINIMEIFGHI